MTLLDTTLARPEAAALGWTLVHFIWQGGVIAIALAVTLPMLRRVTPNVRYATCAAAMLLLVAAPLVTFAVLLAGATPSTIAAPLATPVTEPAVWSMADRLAPLLPRLTAVWFAGMCFFQLRLLVNWLRAQDLRRRATFPATERWRATAATLARSMGVRRPVRLLESGLAPTAAVVGWLRPVVLIPSTAFTGLTPAQLRAIIAHELAHVRRHDYLVNLLQSVAESLLFYHPAVWWVSHRLRVEREYCCDDLVLGVCDDAVGYARALCALEDLRDRDVQPALASTGGSLMHRITRLIGTAPARPGRRIGAWIVPSLTAAAVTIAATALTGAAAEVAPPKKTEEVVHLELQAIQETSLEGLDLAAIVREVDPDEAELVALLTGAGFDNQLVLEVMQQLGTDKRVLAAVKEAMRPRPAKDTHGTLHEIWVDGMRERGMTDAEIELAMVKEHVRLRAVVEPERTPEALIDLEAAKLEARLAKGRAAIDEARDRLAAIERSGKASRAEIRDRRRELELAERELVAAREQLHDRIAVARDRLAALRAEGLDDEAIRARMHEARPIVRRLPRGDHLDEPREAELRELELRLHEAHLELMAAMKDDRIAPEELALREADLQVLKERLHFAHARAKQKLHVIREHIAELKEHGMTEAQIREAIEMHLRKMQGHAHDNDLSLPHAHDDDRGHERDHDRVHGHDDDHGHPHEHR